MYQASIATCYGRALSCGLDFTQTSSDGSTYVLAQEIPRIAVLLRDNDGIQFGEQTICREERSSMYGLFVAMAVEIELIKSLQPDEAPPKGWTPSLSAPWEDCASRSVAEYQTLSEDLRKNLLPELRRTLATVQEQLRSRKWASAQASSVPLAELALEVARSAARDYPSGDSPVWGAIRSLAWDAERVSADIGVKRLAALSTTAKLIDSVLADIDRIDTSKPLR